MESILIPWFAYQNQSVLAAEALVEAVVNLYRARWSVERVQLELGFLSLQQRNEGMTCQVRRLPWRIFRTYMLAVPQAAHAVAKLS